MTVSIEIGIGELVDRLTILKIKMSEITDETKLANVKTEYEYLLGISDAVETHPQMEQLLEELYDVNSELWDVEDDLRECEKKKSFGKDFIELARSVYRLNDRRAAIKKEINQLHGSKFIEEKSYKS
jgi:predicted nuclease with TOPRIM domain